MVHYIVKIRANETGIVGKLFKKKKTYNILALNEHEANHEARMRAYHSDLRHVRILTTTQVESFQ